MSLVQLRPLRGTLQAPGCRVSLLTVISEMQTFRLIAFSAVLLTALACLETPPFAPDVTEVNFDPSLEVDIANSVRTESGLYYRDITVGDGDAIRAESGDSALVRYTGWLRNGIEFDSNLGAASPLRFATGAGAVIEGFDEGVRGMRVNGTRQLIIPPQLGYGASSLPNIPRYSILVFNITLTGVAYPTPNAR